MDYTVKQAKPGDEATLAYIQTESWKAGFKDILNTETLARYTQIDKAVAMYRHLLEQNIGNGYLLEVEGEAHCIAWWDAAREKSMNEYAELICIHSLQSRWRKGYGSKMMAAVLHDIKAAGYTKVMLWVFENNYRARQFYETLGFITNGKKKNDFDAIEICYEMRL